MDMSQSGLQKPRHRRRNGRERGNAVIEVSLLAPWIFFLLVGILDLGFYSYAAIATENAARVAAQYAAAGPSTAGEFAGHHPWHELPVASVLSGSDARDGS